MVPLSAFIATLLTTLGILAIPLIIWSFRGRRVCDHPYCRRCGFDLFGRPATSPRCSECGAELDRPKAIRAGRRERRRWPLAVGLAVFVLMAGYWGHYAVQRVTHLGAADKPTWWLLRDADSKNAAYARTAVDELVHRQKKGQLSIGDTRKLIDRVLDLSSKGSIRLFDWEFVPIRAFAHSDYREIIEQAYDTGVLTDAQWHRCWQQLCQLSLWADKTVRPGAALQIALEYTDQGPWRVAELVEIRAIELSIGGVACPVPNLTENQPRPFFGKALVPLLPASAFKPGLNKVSLTLELYLAGSKTPYGRIKPIRAVIETQTEIVAP